MKDEIAGIGATSYEAIAEQLENGECGTVAEMLDKIGLAMDERLKQSGEGNLIARTNLRWLREYLPKVGVSLDTVISGVDFHFVNQPMMACKTAETAEVAMTTVAAYLVARFARN